MKELTVQEAALAWANGRIVEVMGPASIEWAPVVKVGGGIGEWFPSVFTVSEGKYRFRLAPVPPAKKWRPWTAEEVPVGAIIRAVGMDWRSLITGVSASGEVYSFIGSHKREYIFKNHEFSVDSGKTWKSCGVEVTE